MALMALQAMVCDALAAGAHEADATCATDRGAAAFVLVVGCDVADAGVQPHGNGGPPLKSATTLGISATKISAPALIS